MEKKIICFENGTETLYGEAYSIKDGEQKRLHMERMNNDRERN